MPLLTLNVKDFKDFTNLDGAGPARGAMTPGRGPGRVSAIGSAGVVEISKSPGEVGVDTVTRECAARHSFKCRHAPCSRTRAEPAPTSRDDARRPAGTLEGKDRAADAVVREFDWGSGPRIVSPLPGACPHRQT